MKDKIILYVWNNKAINNFLKKRINSNHYDDFKSELIMILYNMKEEKLFKAYEEGYIDLLVYRIIHTQWKSGTSEYARKYKKNICIPSDNEILDYNVSNEDWSVIYDIDNQEFLNGYKEYFYSKIDKVKDELLHINPYDAYVFNLYYFEDMTYKEIGEKTKINYVTIRQMVIRTLEKIIKKI